LKYNSSVKTKITGFHLDEDNHWVADLSCGHTQHFRHNPPWQQREWVLSVNRRNDFIGFELECKVCKAEITKTRN